jgi:hypothetical protein
MTKKKWEAMYAMYAVIGDIIQSGALKNRAKLLRKAYRAFSKADRTFWPKSLQG